MNDKEDSSKWENLHNEERHQPKYPAESCIRFVKGNLREGARVLDDGCGAGRHTVFLAEEGYVPYAIDYSSIGVECTKNRLRKQHFFEYEDNVYQASCSQLPFEDGFFDGCICYGVLYYMKKEAIEQSVKEIYRVLKEGGMCMFHIRSVDDYRFKGDSTINGDNHGLYINETDDGKSASEENGMFMHFFDKKELEQLLSCFSSITIDLEKIYHENNLYCDANYVVICKK